MVTMELLKKGLGRGPGRSVRVDNPLETGHAKPAPVKGV